MLHTESTELITDGTEFTLLQLQQAIKVRNFSLSIVHIQSRMGFLEPLAKGNEEID